ncbi:hypothetical protein BFL43_21705 [Williamsia sp. 1135]|nr:hypothetical protein BFL43_21705 [Williamsia sp. 1135]
MTPRAVAEPVDDAGPGLRAIGALSRLYSKLVAETPAVTALSPARPRRRGGFEFEAVVDRIEREADDVRSFLLRRPDGAALPAWRPGAHIDVTTTSGVLRQYSLSGNPVAADCYRIAVRRVVDGTASSEMHRLREGERLRIRGPRNAFPMARAPHYLFVAGGIGITPILSMVYAACHQGLPWVLYYHGRSRSSMPFLGELEGLAERGGGTLIVADDDVDGPPGIDAILTHAKPGGALYACGPAGLSAAVRARSRVIAPNTTFHTEYFSPPPIVDGEPFEIAMQSTGERIAVGAHESALDAVRRLRPDQAYSCRQGFCGACVVGVVDGQPDHRDRVLGDIERGSAMTLCVSRAALDETLTLDL